MAYSILFIVAAITTVCLGYPIENTEIETTTSKDLSSECGGIVGFFHICPINGTDDVKTNTSRRSVDSSNNWGTEPIAPETSEEESDENIYKRDEGDLSPEQESGIESNEERALGDKLIKRDTERETDKETHNSRKKRQAFYYFDDDDDDILELRKRNAEEAKDDKATIQRKRRDDDEDYMGNAGDADGCDNPTNSNGGCSDDSRRRRENKNELEPSLQVKGDTTAPETKADGANLSTGKEQKRDVVPLGGASPDGDAENDDASNDTSDSDEPLQKRNVPDEDEGGEQQQTKSDERKNDIEKNEKTSPKQKRQVVYYDDSESSELKKRNVNEGKADVTKTKSSRKRRDGEEVEDEDEGGDENDENDSSDSSGDDCGDEETRKKRSTKERNENNTGENPVQPEENNKKVKRDYLASEVVPSQTKASINQLKNKRDVPPLGGASPTDNVDKSKVKRESESSLAEKEKKKNKRNVPSAEDGDKSKVKRESESLLAEKEQKKNKRNVPPIGGASPTVDGDKSKVKRESESSLPEKEPKKNKRNVPSTEDGDISKVKRESESSLDEKEQKKNRRNVPPIGGASPTVDGDKSKVKRESESSLAEKEPKKNKRNVPSTGDGDKSKVKRESESSLAEKEPKKNKRNVSSNNIKRGVDSRLVAKDQKKDKRDVHPLAGESATKVEANRDTVDADKSRVVRETLENRNNEKQNTIKRDAPSTKVGSKATKNFVSGREEKTASNPKTKRAMTADKSEGVKSTGTGNIPETAQDTILRKRDAQRSDDKKTVQNVRKRRFSNNASSYNIMERTPVLFGSGS